MEGPTRRGVLALGAVGAAAGVAGGLERLSTAGVFERTGAGQAAWPSTVGMRPNGDLVTISRAARRARGAGESEGIGAAGGNGDGEGGDDRREPVLVDGSRVVADADAGTDAVTSAVEAERRWLAVGLIPGEGGPFEDMSRSALLDLRVMLRPRGALLEAWARDRDGVVTRTAAFGAAALAACGHVDDALDVLTFLGAVQQPDGTLFGSYRPDQFSSGTLEEVRGREDRPENAGWMLWAANRAMLGSPWRRSRRISSPVRSLVIRSFTKVVNTLGADSLPPPRPGYVNGFPRRLELARAAPMLAGLQAAVEIEQRGGSRVQAFAIADAALRFDTALTDAFGPDYPATLGGTVPDESVAYLLPPIGAGSDPRRSEVIRKVEARLTRPLGLIVPGRTLAPTAPIALVALADSYSDAPQARARSIAALRWLDRHRTEHGSLPEAVQFNGAPAGPAPFTWTAAIVLLTLAGPPVWR